MRLSERKQSLRMGIGKATIQLQQAVVQQRNGSNKSVQSAGGSHRQNGIKTVRLIT